MLVHAAYGESQYKLQSVRNALDATPGGRFKVTKDHHYPMATRLSLLQTNEVIEVLVQFAYDVNIFPATKVAHEYFAFT